MKPTLFLSLVFIAFNLSQQAFAGELARIPAEWLKTYGASNSPFEAFQNRVKSKTESAWKVEDFNQLLNRRYDPQKMGLPRATTLKENVRYLEREIEGVEANYQQLAGKSIKTRNATILKTLTHLLETKIESHPSTLLLYSVGGIHAIELFLRSPEALQQKMGFVYFPTDVPWKNVGVNKMREALELLDPTLIDPWKRMVRRNADEHFYFNTSLALEWFDLPFVPFAGKPPVENFRPELVFFMEDHLIASTKHLDNFPPAKELKESGFRQVVAVVEGLPAGKYTVNDAIALLRKNDTGFLEAALPALAEQFKRDAATLKKAQALLAEVPASSNPQVTAFLQMLQRLETALPVTLFSVD